MDSIKQAERGILCVLFRHHPGDFVWIGGSVLQLLHSSPRASYDLDLALQHALPPSNQLVALLRETLEKLNEVLHQRYTLERAKAETHSNTSRLVVTESGASVFSVDFTRIVGHVPETATVVLHSPLGPQAVVVPTDSYLLELKLEVIILRRYLKVADVFDAWFLLSRGVRLEKQHRRRLADEIAAREIEFENVESRFRKLTPERFLHDLKRRVPAEEFHSWSTARARSAIDSVWEVIRREVRWR